MGGRCGNQLFRYACARYVSFVTKDNEMTFDYTNVYKGGTREDGWIDYMEDFNVVNHQKSNSLFKLLVLKTNLIQKFLLIIIFSYFYIDRKNRCVNSSEYAKRYQKLLNRHGLFVNGKGIEAVYPDTMNQVKNKFVLFMSEFAPDEVIKTCLQEEITPKKDVDSKYRDLYEEIENADNSVCVSVRRGDFFDEDKESRHGVCDEKYYVSAIEKVEAQIENPVFYFFSDDIEWCSKTFEKYEKCVFVTQDMPVYETLRLMYSCKHFIISNSTFSWWGQYLSQNDNKVVVSPRVWNRAYKSMLVDEKWILIDS